MNERPCPPNLPFNLRYNIFYQANEEKQGKNGQNRDVGMYMEKETVARLQSILFGRHLLLGAKSWQKPNLMFGSAGTQTWKVLLVKLDVV
jgi:hypothetical protein